MVSVTGGLTGLLPPPEKTNVEPTHLSSLIGNQRMALPKGKLCILTPDNFYGVLLREAVFPTFDVRVLKSSNELQSLAVNFFPDAFLLFSEHLGPTVLAKTLLEIRSKFPKVSVFQIEGVRQASVQILWSNSTTNAQAIAPVAVENVADIDRAIRLLTDDIVEGRSRTNLTKSQLDVLRAVAEGQSNAEIANARNTTVRAVEALLNRALSRISDDSPVNSQARILIAQKYLGWHLRG